MFNTKTSAAGLSIVSNSVIILLKLTAGILIGSVSVISEAIHSMMDLLAAIIAFASLRAAVQPADEEHPFGHGKMEDVSAAAEAGLILMAVFLILYEAIRRIIEGAVVISPELGIAVMGFTMVANIGVSTYLHRIAKATDSVALEADAKHLSTDVFTSLGVLLGLVVVRITGLNILDPIVAIGVALFIVRTAYKLLKKSFGDLVDRKLPEREEAQIRAIIDEHYGQLAGYHELRTRKSGSERHIDLHLVLARDISIQEAHSLCDHLEEDIKAQLSQTTLTIHVEPCDSTCDQCPEPCPPEVSRGR